MAGYCGLLSGAAGLAAAIRGVGAGNLVGGVVNASLERVPVVAVCDAYAASWKGSGGVQNCDHHQLFAATAEYQARLDPANSAAAVKEAFFQPKDGRPGASVLDSPGDLGETGVAEAAEKPAAFDCPVEPAALDRAREFLARSARPAILAGADVVRAGAARELQKIAEALGAPVLVTMDARGVFPKSHPLWAGVLIGFFNPCTIETPILAKAEALLMVGADATMTNVPWKASLPVCELTARCEYQTLHLNPDVRATGNLKDLLRGLAPTRRPGIGADPSQSARQEILRCFARPGQATFAAQDFLEITRHVLSSDAMLFSDTGAYVRMLEELWLVPKPGTYFGTAGGRTMGLTLPAMIGARLADRHTPMVDIGGDGSTLMRLGELQAPASRKTAFPLVVINDQALGTIKWRQQSRGFAGHGLDFPSIDFAGVAAACGLRGVQVSTPEAFEWELRGAMDADRATLIDARVDPAAYQASFGATVGMPSDGGASDVRQVRG
jgi:acetolactate synthase I/II/III large subunit